MGEFRLTPDMIGMNNYSDYDPAWCDGHHCPRDCEKCEYRAENRGDTETVTYDPFTGRIEDEL